MSVPVASPDDPPYLRGLNAPQREAVLTTDGPVRDVSRFGDEFVRQDGTPVAGPVRAWRESLTCVARTVRQQTGIFARVEDS